MGDVLPPKRQVVERLKRRFDLYRKHQNNCLPRYEQAENGLYEAQRQDTQLLKQRYLESKAKKTKNNKSDHHRAYKESVTDGAKSQPHPKPLKRPVEEPIPNPSTECATGEDNEKPSKILRTDISSDKLSDIKTQQPTSLSSFSVQIVQQFSKGSHGQQPQTIQSNNVKVQQSISLNKPLNSPLPQTAPNSQDTVCKSQDNQQSTIQLVECKQEKDCGQPELCQFKNGQNSTSDRLSDTFPSLGFTDDSGDDVIHPDLLKDLIDDVFTNSADIMKDFNFDDSVGSMKDQDEATKDIIGDLMKESSAMQLRPFQTDLFVNTSVNLQQQQHHHHQQQQQQQQHQHQHLQQQQNNIFKNISSAGEVPLTSIVTSAPTPPTTASNFYNTASQRLPSYSSSPVSIPNGLSLDFKLSEPSPAALTLKQMAEQHQNMQQKQQQQQQQQQQQFVNSPLSNRPSPFNQESFNPHMNTMRTTNNYIPGSNPGLQTSSPKTPNSNNMFNAFDRQLNSINFTNTQTINNLPNTNQTINSLPSNNQPLNSLPPSNQQISNLSTSNPPLNNLPSNSQSMNKLPMSPNHIFEADIHSRTSNVMSDVDRAKQNSCQTMQQQKPPAYATRPLAHFADNQHIRLQNPVGNQHQRPMGRQQFQNSMQIAQTSQMHTSQGHRNPQQLQSSTHDIKPQHHMLQQHQSHNNVYVSFPSQQPVNNPTFHVSMAQSIPYSAQFTSSQTLSRPPPEYKAHHSNLPVDNVNLIEQLNQAPSNVIFSSNPTTTSKGNSKFARHQKSPNVTITPEGTAISSSALNWRHMINEQQSNQLKINNFQNNYANFVRNEQQQQPSSQQHAPVQAQLYAQYRMPSTQMMANRMVLPNVVPNQLLIQQRQRIAMPQQRSRNPTEMDQQQQQHSVMAMSNNMLSGLTYANQPDISRADGNQINLDFLDNIESSASDLLNFDMQGGGAHFPLLDDMEILGK